MSKLYNDCFYQLYFHIINNSSTEFTANTLYDYLNTYYNTLNRCPVVGHIESTMYDQKLRMRPFAFYASTSGSSNKDVIVSCMFIDGDNIIGNLSDELTFSCRNGVASCNDDVITILDSSK